MVMTPQISTPSSSIATPSWFHCFATATIIFLLGISGMYTATLLKNKGALVSIGNLFACGILLAAAFVHTIPSAQIILNPNNQGYPLSGLVVGGTFIVLLLVEELVHLYTNDDVEEHQQLDEENGGTKVEHGHGHGSGSQCGHQHGHGSQHRTIPNSPLPNAPKHGHGHGHGSKHRTIPNSPLPNAQRLESTVSPLLPSSSSSNPSQTHTHQSHLESHLQSSTVAGLMLFVMLDLHSLFAGMSVGVKLNDLSLLFALGIHKLTAAFALGSTLCTINISTSRYVFCAVFFSCMAPLGVLVGCQLANSDPTSNTLFGIIYSVVGGTFIYIAILALGMKELLVCRTDAHGSGVLISLEKFKLAALVVGYVVMAVLALWL